MKKTMRNALIALSLFTSTAFAAGSSTAGDGSLLVSLFVGFFTLIVVFQMVPAAIMLIGMLKGLFGSETESLTSH